MNLQDIVKELELTVLTRSEGLDNIQALTAYQSDLLSCVMSGAGEESIWITLINNINIVAVAKLLDIPAIIITENAMPEEATIERANMEGVNLFLTPKGNFEIAGRLFSLGINP
ncbi:MAG TPA: hypothetical protein VLR89_07775 [Anaerolineaceae bacterium]|nr:hypothetical protein [Anaerolineaceae bacterium]